MVDDVLCEQLTSVMSDEVRQFIVSKQVKNSDECCEFADLYAEMNVNASATGMAARKPPSGSGGQPAPGAAGVGGQPRNNAPRGGGGSGSSGGGGGAGTAGTNAANNGGLRGRCYSCNAFSHKRAECPQVNRGGEGLESVHSAIFFTLHISNVMCVPFMPLRQCG